MRFGWSWRGEAKGNYTESASHQVWLEEAKRSNTLLMNQEGSFKSPQLASKLHSSPNVFDSRLALEIAVVSGIYSPALIRDVFSCVVPQSCNIIQGNWRKLVGRVSTCKTWGRVSTCKTCAYANGVTGGIPPAVQINIKNSTSHAYTQQRFNHRFG